jgi:heme/copper-type cytochrome/quinol oxidase subunit 1
LRSRRAGAPAGDNPWNAWTLEWATTSPPPPTNFRPGALRDVLPVRSRTPLMLLQRSALSEPERSDG